MPGQRRARRRRLRRRREAAASARARRYGDEVCGVTGAAGGPAKLGRVFRLQVSRRVCRVNELLDGPARTPPPERGSAADAGSVADMDAAPEPSGRALGAAYAVAGRRRSSAPRSSAPRSRATARASTASFPSAAPRPCCSPPCSSRSPSARSPRRVSDARAACSSSSLVLLVAWTGATIAWSIAPDRSWDAFNRSVAFAAFLGLGVVLAGVGGRCGRAARRSGARARHRRRPHVGAPREGRSRRSIPRATGSPGCASRSSTGTRSRCSRTSRSRSGSGSARRAGRRALVRVAGGAPRVRRDARAAC